MTCGRPIFWTKHYIQFICCVFDNESQRRKLVRHLVFLFCLLGVVSEAVGNQIHRSCSLESVRVASPRDVTGDDDVIGGQVLLPTGVRRTRGFNESFRAAVDRSYNNRQTASRGEHYIYETCRATFMCWTVTVSRQMAAELIFVASVLIFGRSDYVAVFPEGGLYSF